MTAEPATSGNQLDLPRYLARTAGWAAGALVLVLATPLCDLLCARPTVSLAALLLQAAGESVWHGGSTIQVGLAPPRTVLGYWTAAPPFLIGAAFILTWPATAAKRALGLVAMLVDTVLINLVVLGWVTQAPDLTIDGVCRGLRLVYPPLMAGVVGVTLLYWLLRVVPERRPSAPVAAPPDETEAAGEVDEGG
jgi:hypothetical protein